MFVVHALRCAYLSLEGFLCLTVAHRPNEFECIPFVGWAGGDIDHAKAAASDFSAAFMATPGLTDYEGRHGCILVQRLAPRHVITASDASAGSSYRRYGHARSRARATAETW